MTNSETSSLHSMESFAHAASDLRDLITSCDRLIFLLGAGCSKSAGLPLTRELTDEVLEHPSLNSTSKDILTDVQQVFADSEYSHIEDYLSEMVDLLAIANRRAARGVNSSAVSVGSTEYTADQLSSATNDIKHVIARIVGKQTPPETHRLFVSSVHEPLRVGRPSPVSPVDYLVLNYDTIIEDALALEKIPYADGLSGGAIGWWNPDTFEATPISARVIKLHGSVDWFQLPDDPLPRRLGPSVQDQRDIPLLIWPSSAKYQQTQLNPFAHLLGLARQAMHPQPGHQHLLIICGYSFGDEHINSEIERALRQSHGNLTVVAFTDNCQPTGLLLDWHRDFSIRDQVRIYTSHGFYHGDTTMTSGDNLTWWQFEKLTALLRGDT